MPNFITDPRTKEPSVSLTLLLVTFASVLLAACLQMAGVISDTSVLTELFYANSALYFGRRFTFKNNNYSSEKTEGSKE